MMTTTTPLPPRISPVYMTLELFQLLDTCETLADSLMECTDNAHRQTLYHRLAECLEAMELEKPLPPYWAAEREAETRPTHTAGSAERLRLYCYTVTSVLIDAQQTPETNNTLNALLFRLINLLVEALLAPQFKPKLDS